jgi:hypothetical protein
MKETLRITHDNTAEFLEAAKLHSVKVYCLEEGLENDLYEVQFTSPFDLFYLGQSMGLNVGHRITRKYYAK